MTKWKETELAEIAEVRAGSPAPQGAEYFDPNGVPFVRVQDVGRYGRTTCLTETKDRINQYAIDTFRPAFAKAGTIVFPKSGAAINTNSRAILGIDAYVVSHLAMVTAKDGIVLPEWLYFWFCSFDLASLSRTTSLPSVRLSDIKKLKIPLPEIAEQRRIVARIKECMERVEEIERLRAEAIEEAKGIYPSRCHDFFSEHDSASGWYKTTIGELALSIRYGYTQRATKSPVGPRFLRITDIQNHSVDWESVPYCEAEAKAIEKYKLKEGDILFARTGATTGKSFLIEGTPPLAVFASYLIRLQIDKERVLPRLIYHFFQSPAYWDQVRRNMRGGAQPNINARILSSLSVIIPRSFDEQERIVEQLDRAFELSLRLSATVSNQTEPIRSLRETILRKAFAGEL